MKRIDHLTDKQLVLLDVCREEWLRHGLATGPADRASAEAGVKAAYVSAGLEPPRFIIWLESPLAGAYGQALAPVVIQTALRQVRPQVEDHVETQVRDQVEAQVYVQVGDEVREQVREQVWDRVGDRVWDQVEAQVWAQVRDQVGNQVDGHVEAQVLDAIRKWSRALNWGQHDASWLSFYAAMEAIGVTGLESVHGQQQIARNSGWWWSYRNFAVLTERPTVLHHDNQGRLHCEDGPAIVYPDGFEVWAWHGRRVDQ